jgi:hypothetical protein
MVRKSWYKLVLTATSCVGGSKTDAVVLMITFEVRSPCVLVMILARGLRTSLSSLPVRAAERVQQRHQSPVAQKKRRVCAKEVETVVTI